MGRAQSTTKGCWTCKDRRIACDRTLPFCNKCTKSNRRCGGYSMRLSWPRPEDHRRSVRIEGASNYNSAVARKHASTGYAQFLNTTSADVEYFLRQRSRLEGQSIEKALSSIQWSREDGPTLLSLYEAVVSRRMRSVSDEDNGFLHVILPMALSSSCYSSSAVLQAMLAVAAAHGYGDQEAANSYRDAAISYLSRTLHYNDENERTCQLAASMLLCTYEICDIDELENWRLHLGGAQRICDTLHGVSTPATVFVRNWALHHVSLRFFNLKPPRAIPYMRPATAGDPSLWPTVDDKYDSTFTPWIIGSLDHSVELLDFLADTNTSILVPEDDPLRQTAQYMADVDNEEYRLKTLQQSFPDPSPQRMEMASLAKQATLIWYQLHVRCLSRNSRRVQHLLNRLLANLAARRPENRTVMDEWVVFVAADVASGDEQRLCLLDLLEGIRGYCIGNQKALQNVDWVREAVEDMWKQRDLAADLGIADPDVPKVKTCQIYRTQLR